MAGSKSKNPRSKSFARWLRRGLGLLVLGAIVVALVLAWLPRPVPVDFARVERGPLSVTVDEDGQTRIKDRYVISAPLTGSLARLSLDAGDTVLVGQVLARIVPLMPPLLDARSRASAEAQLAATQAAERQISAQIERANASAEFAANEAARLRALAERGSISPAELERGLLNERTAKAELESLRFGARVARYEVETARANLQRMSGKRRGPEEQLELRSPVNGRVLRLFNENEGVVQAGTQLLEVGDPAALEIAVDVLTADAVQVRPGASVTIDRWGGSALSARVRHIEPSGFTRVGALGVEEQRVNVLIDLTEPRENWAALGDAYRVEAHIVIWEGKEVTQVPASAVFRRGEGWAVYRVDAGVARETRVQVGQTTGQHVQITQGLTPGASVVLHPSDRVSDGVQVEAR